MAYTVDQVCAYAAEVSGLSSSAGSNDRELLDQFVNDAITEVFADTHCVITKVTVTLTADEDEYAMDTGILAVLEYAQLRSAPQSSITVTTAADILQRRSIESVGTVRRFAMLGANILIVSPIPAADDQLLFYVVPVPDQVDTTDDIHVTGLPIFARRAVQCFVIWKAAEVNKDFQTATYWHEEFVKECGKVRKRGRELAGRTLAPNRVGYPETWRETARNDVYPGPS